MDNGTYPEEIEKSKKFSEQNEERINLICSWLSDEESLNTYRQALRIYKKLINGTEYNNKRVS